MRITCAPTRLALKHSGVGEGVFALLVFFWGGGGVSVAAEGLHLTVAPA